MPGEGQFMLNAALEDGDINQKTYDDLMAIMESKHREQNQDYSFGRGPKKDR